MTDRSMPTPEDLRAIIATARGVSTDEPVEPFTSMEVIWLISAVEGRTGVELADLVETRFPDMTTAETAAAALQAAAERLRTKPAETP